MIPRFLAACAAVLLMAAPIAAQEDLQPATTDSPFAGEGAWAMDFTREQPSERDPLEARYTGPDRVALELVAADYRAIQQLRPPLALVDAVTGAPVLRVEVMDADGKVWRSVHSPEKARINLYRRGPYFNEIHVFDLTVADAEGNVAPLLGDLAYYATPRALHASINWHVKEGEFEIASVRAVGPDVVLDGPGAIRPGQPRMVTFPIFADDAPIPAGNLETITGEEPLRYDPVRGAYVIGTHNPGGFEQHFFDHPNGYERAHFRIQNDDQERVITVCHETSSGVPGLVEGGVLLDAQGHPLPIRVQVSKNFAGEKEEPFYNPEDTPFSETYFTLHLAPHEVVELHSYHLYQNWGRKPVKQWSSLGAWMDYFHSSTGVTETTCYVPFKFAGLHGVTIADMRATSMDFWVGQPQHHNIAGHYFLQYREREGAPLRSLVYRGTEYRSTGNNWFDVTLHYESSDGAFTAAVDAFETPQLDELRSFFRLRIQAAKPVKIEDPAKNLALAAMTGRIQSLEYTRFGSSGGDPVDLPQKQDAWPVVGQPLDPAAAFVTVVGEDKGANAFVLTGWQAPAGLSPAASVRTFERGHCIMTITTRAETFEMQPGEELVLEGFILPYAPTDEIEPAAREMQFYATDGPRVESVATGRKVSDWPIVVEAAGGEAEFTIAGGRELLPVIVTNLPTWKSPRIEQMTAGGWQPIHHHYLSPYDGAEVHTEDGGTFRAVFLVASDGEPRQLRAMAGSMIAPPPMMTVRPADGGALDLVDAMGQQRATFAAPTDLSINGETIEVPAPTWTETDGGSHYYHQDVAPDVAVGVRITPREDYVDLEYWLQNRRGEPVTFDMAMQVAATSIAGADAEAIPHSDGRGDITVVDGGTAYWMEECATAWSEGTFTARVADRSLDAKSRAYLRGRLYLDTTPEEIARNARAMFPVR